MSWCLKYWRDVVADLRAFFHLTPDQALALPGPELMALIYRTPFFQGVVAARYANEQEEEKRRTGAHRGGTSVPATRGGIAAAGLDDLFEVE